MINLEYINGSIDLEIHSIFKPYELFMESCENDINKIFAEFGILEEKVTLESAIMGSVPESMMMVYESEKKNIFTKIGEMIVTVYNKFVELVDKVIDTIKTHAFKKKTDLQKLEIILKNHPDLKNEAIAAFNEGALDLSDVRSFKELDSTFDEILKMAKKKDVDPKTLRGKWEKAKEKFEKGEKSWKMVATVAGATGAVITTTVALKSFNSKCLKATNDANEEKKKLRQSKAEILDQMNKAGYDTSDLGKWQLILQMWRFMNEKYAILNKERTTVISKMADGITKFISRFDKEAGKAYVYNLSKVKERMDEENDKKNKSDIQKAKDEQKARKEAEDEYYNSHRREELKKERDKAFNQSEARQASKDRHEKSNDNKD